MNKRVTALAAALCVAGASIVGCASQTAENVNQVAATEDQGPLAPVATVDDGATISPSRLISVTSPDSTLTALTLTNELGTEVANLDGEGKLESSYSDSTWTLEAPLGYSHQYTLTATDGNGVTTTTKFATLTPQATTNVIYTQPAAGTTVGIGSTINFRFGQAIPDAAKQEVEDSITVETNPPTEGALYWLNDTEVRWRPKEYWKPGTTVHAELNQFGKNLGAGIYGGDDASTDFTIGDAMIAYADDNTHMLTVTKNGEVINEIPISMGMNNPAFVTPNGTYTIGMEFNSLVMDSETFGLSHAAGGYVTTVAYATQMSYSGIYVHAAPWSVGVQGYANASHGCLNMSTANAKWFMDNFTSGDLVQVSNTIGGTTLSPYDGLGDWNFTWDEISGDPHTVTKLTPQV
ncbi:MAG: Ig-like domain-containing protein [Corynebacterium sp.]|nr:Ig-like domain-containing protein [Corynebacterium sp.]